MSSRLAGRHDQTPLRRFDSVVHIEAVGQWLEANVRAHPGKYVILIPRASRCQKDRQNLLAEYGAVAVVVYFVIFFAVLGGFWLAVRFGWRP